MAATFGELVGKVGADLNAAAAYAGPMDEYVLDAALGQLRRLVLTLSRYMEDVAPHDLMSADSMPDLAGWMKAAVEAREALELAAGNLGAGPEGGPDRQPVDPVVGILDAAATSLAAGRDLLFTHFATDSDGTLRDRSGWSAALRSERVGRALVESVSTWSEKLTRLVDSLSPAPDPGRSSPLPTHLRLAGARHWLEAARLALQRGMRDDPVTAADMALLMSIPGNAIPGRPVPKEPESVPVLAGHIRISATRLRAITLQTADIAAWSPAITADSWRWTATAAAIVSDLSDRMLSSMAGEAENWPGRPGVSVLLHSAAELSGEACTRWRQATVAWKHTSTESRGLTSPVIADISDLVVRVGRLAFSNPLWTPSLSQRSPLRETGDLAADPIRAAVIIGALHEASDALAHVAAADLRDVSLAARADRLFTATRSLPARYTVPYAYWRARPDAIEAVHHAYQEVVDASAQAAKAVGDVARSVYAPGWRLAARWEFGHPADLTSESLLTPVPVRERRLDTNLSPGAAEQALRKIGVTDAFLMLRAKAIDRATRRLMADASAEYVPHGGPGQSKDMRPTARAAESFPTGRGRSSMSSGPQTGPPRPKHPGQRRAEPPRSKNHP